MKRVFVLFGMIGVAFLSFVLISCGDDSTYPKYDANCKACGVTAPQNNLKWLAKKIKEDMTGSDKTKQPCFVYTFVYNRIELFLFDYAFKSTMGPHEVYDCQGRLIEMSTEMHLELLDKRDKWIRIYQPY